MSTLLHIDASPSGERSVSRRLSAEYAAAWRAANPGGNVIVRDLARTVIPPVDAAWIAAAYTPKESRTAEQRAVLALSDEFIAELRAADRYVAGVPMYNFGVPATTKAYIDQIARVGETFRFGENGPVGLIEGKSAAFMISSGGEYGPGSPGNGLNFVEPYLRAIFGFLGVSDADVVYAGGTASLMAPDADHEAFLAPHLATIRERLRSAAGVV